jgi:hypothetical protein
MTSFVSEVHAKKLTTRQQVGRRLVKLGRKVRDVAGSGLARDIGLEGLFSVRADLGAGATVGPYVMAYVPSRNEVERLAREQTTTEQFNWGATAVTPLPHLGWSRLGGVGGGFNLVFLQGYKDDVMHLFYVGKPGFFGLMVGKFADRPAFVHVGNSAPTPGLPALRVNAGVSIYSSRLEPLANLTSPVAGGLHWVGQKLTAVGTSVGNAARRVPGVEKTLESGKALLERGQKKGAALAAGLFPAETSPEKIAELQKKGRQLEEALRQAIDLVGVPGEWIGQKLEQAGGKLQRE